LYKIILNVFNIETIQLTYLDQNLTLIDHFIKNHIYFFSNQKISLTQLQKTKQTLVEQTIVCIKLFFNVFVSETIQLMWL
jgi:hypothetical protein